MSYTEEIAEEVLKDFNELYGAGRELCIRDKKFLSHKFPKAVSGWYKDDKYPKWLMYYDFDKKVRYGTVSTGEWTLTTYNVNFPPKRDYLIDLVEAEQQLIEEAERRGFVEGAEFLEAERQRGSTGEKGRCNGLYKLNVYEDGEQVLLSCGRALMCNGVWAEIIEQPKNEVEEALDKLKKDVKKLEKLINKNK